MNIAAVITEIRKDRNLTQDELAGKLFVTRQAVSRWENGETTPTADTLKAISELFGVDANAFFGNDPPVCQSCAMPLKGFDDLGAEGDGGVNTEYCKYCYGGGHFTHDRTVGEMIETNMRFLKEFNEGNGVSFSEAEARVILKQYLPTLKRWKKD